MDVHDFPYILKNILDVNYDYILKLSKKIIYI